MGISKESATDLKHASNALAEAEQHLRTCGNYTEGVAEAAAADYIEKRDEFEAKLEEVRGQVAAEDSEETPENDERPDLAADVAAAGEEPQDIENSPGSDAGTKDEEDRPKDDKARKDTGKKS